MYFLILASDWRAEYLFTPVSINHAHFSVLILSLSFWYSPHPALPSNLIGKGIVTRLKVPRPSEFHAFKYLINQTTSDLTNLLVDWILLW